MLTRVRPLACAAAAAAALALPACGGGGGGVSSDDPASLAPASAPLYFQATLRPKGKLKANVEKLSSTVSGIKDPLGQVVAMIDQSLASNKPLSGKTQTFEKDFEPWIGNRAGVFVEGFSGSPSAAGIVQTTDPAATQRAIDDGREKGDKQRSYKGVDYLVGGQDGTAVGVVGDFVLIGDEKGLKDAVDVSKGDSDALGDQSDFTTTLDQAPPGSLAEAYVSLEAVTNELRARSISPAGSKGFESAVGDTSGKSALASLVPSSDSAEVDLSTNASQNIQLTDLSKLIGTLPRQSFATIGIPDLGNRIGETIDQLQKAGVQGVSRKAIDQQLALTGISLDDITKALGDLGIFAEGSDRGSLQGAGVITSPDPAAAKSLIGNLAKLALSAGQRGIKPAAGGTGFSITDPANLGSQPLTITASGGKIVIGYGQQATAQALTGGGGSLGQDPTYKQATAALGGSGISGYFSLGKIFALADALGARHDPGYVQARPYLNHLSYAILGSASKGDFSTSKVIVGIKP
jgi:Protein of unknown function (DUF3352)